MTPINPNQLFDTGREDLTQYATFNAILRDGQLFRYRDDGNIAPSSQLEMLLSTRLGHEAAFLTSSGTTGLELALRALGVKPGDKVAVTAFSFIACSMAVVNVGAIPVPIDISPTLEVTVRSEDLDDDRLTAAIVVHMQGHASHSLAFIRACAQRSIPVVEDLCQALGAQFSEPARVGSLGRIAVTSFQQSKQLAAGEGGAVIGCAEDIDRIRSLADLGSMRGSTGLPSWDDPKAGFGTNARLSELQAALVLDQFLVLDDTIRRQRQNRDSLAAKTGLVGLGLGADQARLDAGSHTVFKAKSRIAATEFVHALSGSGVHARIVWPRAFPEYGVYRRAKKYAQSGGRFTTAAEVAPRIVSIPTPKYLASHDIEVIADAVVRSSDLLCVGE